jgi:glutamate--cysteine ligase
MLSPASLYAHLRDEAFALGRAPASPPRIGAEAELIPVDAQTGTTVPISTPEGGGTLPLLRRFGARGRAWREVAPPGAVPHFILPDGGIVSYEPGGQIELSTAPHPSGSGLLAALRATLIPLVAEAADAGVSLLGVGIEPRSPLAAVPLQLTGARYVRMTEFMRAIGSGGERMMRQTAALQVSLDAGPEPLSRWRFLNALPPYLTAMFANSPVYEDVHRGHASYRAHVWRMLDGGRTGLLGAAPDPVDEYLTFALRAPTILDPGGPPLYAPFAHLLAAGTVDAAAWKTHLTTLFPEVRPRGFFEVRSIDAMPPERFAAPLVFLAGLTYDERSFREAADLVGSPDPELLVLAGRDGLKEPRLAATSVDLVEVALQGARRLTPAFFDASDVEEAEAFFARYTLRSRAPADDVPHAAPMVPA